MFLSSPLLTFNNVSLKFLFKHFDSCLNTIRTIKRCIRCTFLSIFTFVYLFMLLDFCLICQHSVLITENTEVHLFFSQFKTIFQGLGSVNFCGCLMFRSWMCSLIVLFQYLQQLKLLPELPLQLNDLGIRESVI